MQNYNSGPGGQPYLQGDYAAAQARGFGKASA